MNYCAVLIYFPFSFSSMHLYIYITTFQELNYVACSKFEWFIVVANSKTVLILLLCNRMLKVRMLILAFTRGRSFLL